MLICCSPFPQPVTGNQTPDLQEAIWIAGEGSDVELLHMARISGLIVELSFYSQPFVQSTEVESTAFY